METAGQGSKARNLRYVLRLQRSRHFVFKMRNIPSYHFTLCCPRLVLNCN
jgi:hypothetical protein